MARIADEEITDPVIAALLHDHSGLSAQVNATIHPDDQMISFDVEHQNRDMRASMLSYFTVGMQITDTLRQIVAWKFGGFDRVPTLLDFAAGYGRSTRFLVRELPTERVWVSDILSDAVAFQATQFGVRGFVSTTQPEDLVCERRFDCIVVVSLFSHLPERTFVRWLHRLYDLLTEDGVLIFTVHDESLLPPDTVPASGIYYLEISENKVLDLRDYGAAFVSERFVRDAIRHVTGKEAYRRIRKGIGRYQDVYVVQRDPDGDFDGMAFDSGPLGSIDICRLSQPTRLTLGGWVADVAPGAFIADIQCIINGRLRQRGVPFFDRPDVAQHLGDEGRADFILSGWSCECAVPEGIAPSDVLLVKAISNRGVSHYLFCDTVEQALRD